MSSRPGAAPSAAARDALLAAGVVLLGAGLFTHFDMVERLLPTLLRFEHVQLDDLLLGAGLAVAASGWFAWRRYRESQRQLAALRASEREKARYVERLEELSAALLATEERERERLAELLHDEVCQTLYACRLKLDALSPELGAAETERRVAEARALAGEALDQTRALTAELHPPVLHDLGLLEAIEWLLPRLEQRFETTARVRRTAAFAAIPRGVHGPLFRSLSELLVNACKHSAATEITISAELAAHGEIRIEVADNGRGFDHSRRGTGFGLLGVERRMACLRGALELRSAPERGTIATLRLSALQ